MKTILNFTVFVLVTLFFVSCDNSIDDINVVIEETGSLEYSIIDPLGEPIDSAKLYLIDSELFSYGISFGPSEDYAIKTVYTDKNGKAEFGKINSGLYLVYCEITTKDNEDYTIFNFVQVVIGEVETRTVDLSKYVGSLDLEIYAFDDFNDYYAADTLNIALIPVDDYSSYYSFEQYMNNAIPIGKTDSDGSISASQIPLGQYFVLGYYNSNRYDILSMDTYYSEYYIYINKDETFKGVMYAESDKLGVTSNSNSSEYQFKVFYTDYNATSGDIDTTYLSNANVLFSNTSSSNFNSAYSYRTYVASTDSSGIAKVNKSQLDDYYSYYLWVYTDMNTYQRLGQYSISNNLTNTTELEVDKETFFKIYGSFEMKGWAKNETGTSIDTISLSNINITLTTSSSTYFSSVSKLYNTKTDSVGHAVINNVPVGEYFLWAYTDDSHAQRAYFKVKIEEDQTTVVEPVFDADQVMILYNDMTLQFYSGSTNSSTPVRNAYVILTKYHESNVASALSSAIVTGNTDEYGIAVLEHLEINTSYYVMVYYDYESYYSPYEQYTVSADPDEVYTILNTGM
ncbi:hypothetical protein [Carboxylicivirga linearis]|uniref:Carboxypeptidase regulatory-like domain-containing protein n=1 Tax=Carboxylicivirga linearis TaxID=1628157 RepID=A0ABS5JWL5_9BACT|nr:hypothetical protein [Carboxylicivirga linearis]MBS2099170.1 hypothetical protein [Carboxylicivirga linearis]